MSHAVKGKEPCYYQWTGSKRGGLLVFLKIDMWVGRMDRERTWAFAALHVSRGTCVYVLGFILWARDMVWDYRKGRDEEKTR